ncbi:MAG: hypothetical protein LBO08_02680 [Rickettsiales bacterium]|jgi:hypothetical protein|nr:hypothetical protein [Rickettsiales bacterium]
MKRLLFIFYLLIFILPAPLHADDPFALGDAAFGNPATIDAGVLGDASLNANSAFRDVDGFDIAGAYLGMDFDAVHNLFFKQSGSLYSPRKKNSLIYAIDANWKNNLDYECRQQKIFVPAELEKCIRNLATKRGLLYASELHLERPQTGETITVYFTSNQTGNIVWQVEYKNDANTADGAGDSFLDQRNKKILKFWQDVLDKYGPPNSGDDTWLSSDNEFDPMLRAYYGKLTLSYLGKKSDDDAMNAMKSREEFNAKPYSF